MDDSLAAGVVIGTRLRREVPRENLPSCMSRDREQFFPGGVYRGRPPRAVGRMFLFLLIFHH